MAGHFAQHLVEKRRHLGHYLNLVLIGLDESGVDREQEALRVLEHFNHALSRCDTVA